MRRYFHILLVCTTLIITTAACDENLADIAGPSTPNLEPTFASIQREIFETPEAGGRRSCISCHTDVGRVPAANLNLLHNVAYDQIVNVAAVTKPGAIRIKPGDPDGSYLVQKVEGTPGIVGLRMPFVPPYLTDGQILILRRWIELGAPRN